MRKRGGGPGPLARFVTSRREYALDLYLLLHAIASAPPWDVSEYASAWARALAISTPKSAASVISENWTWLGTMQLIRSTHEANRRRVFLLSDDGSGAEYERPIVDFFKIPYAYWTSGWHRVLTLPEKSVLLIGLSLRDGFLLPSRQGSEWYGVSSDTIKRGVAGLRDVGLLQSTSKRKPAPLSPTGFTYEHRYTMQALSNPAPASRYGPR
jgi:hypothetical protein